jgi:hypothetical protein
LIASKKFKGNANCNNTSTLLQRQYTYTSKGQPASVTSTINGKKYTESTRYNTYGLIDIVLTQKAQNHLQ